MFFVMFGLVGGLTGGWTGAIGLMAMFLALQALGERIAKVDSSPTVCCFPAVSQAYVIVK